jgi:hypothetical protein
VARKKKKSSFKKKGNRPFFAQKAHEDNPQIIRLDKVYQNNLLALKNFRSHIYQRVIGLSLDENYRIIKTENSLPNLKAHSVLLHSPKDPLSEAKTEIDKIDLSHTNCVILLGFGLGYHALEVMKEVPSDCYLLIIELDINILRAALSALDLRNLLENRHVDFMIGEHVSEIIPKLVDRFSGVSTNNVQVIAHSQSFRLYPEYQNIVEGIVKSSQIVTSNNETRLKYGLRWYENTLKNIMNTDSFSGVNGLFNRFKGVPAIIVSAGPSLDKNIHYLKRIKNEKVLLIAVDTALKCLLSHGIKPDFVASIDCQEITCQFFSGTDFEDIHLVSPFRIPSSIIRKFGSRTLFCDDKELNLWREFRKYLEGLGDINIGGTVAIFAFDLARKLGCDPIIFMGQDLSFPGERYYARGTYRDEMISEGPERHRPDSWQKELMSENEMTQVKNIFSTPVKCTNTMLTWLTWFEVEIRKTASLCINASEEGVLQSDMTISPLREVLFRHLKESSKPGKGFLREAIRRNRRTSLNSLHADIVPVQNRLSTVIQVSQEIIEKCSVYSQAFCSGNNRELNIIHTEIRKLCNKLFQEDEFSSHFKMVYLIFKQKLNQEYEAKMFDHPALKYIFMIELESRSILEACRFFQSLLAEKRDVYKAAECFS